MFKNNECRVEVFKGVFKMLEYTLFVFGKLIFLAS